MKNIIIRPVSTEKCIRLMESENKIVFVVEPRADKRSIKKAVETMFKAKVSQVNTLRTNTGEKRAYVQFTQETPAVDIATQLGMM